MIGNVKHTSLAGCHRCELFLRSTVISLFIVRRSPWLKWMRRSKTVTVVLSTHTISLATILLRHVQTTLTCPHCGARYTTRHVLLECTHLDDLHLETIIVIGHNSLLQLFSTASGASHLMAFLHMSQELLRPL